MKGNNFQSRPAARAAHLASLGLSVAHPECLRVANEHERLLEMRDMNDSDERQVLALSLPMKIGQLISILRGTDMWQVGIAMCTRNKQ